mmetsp:Transcript_28267/g.83015  ORF Transcript_28267/g.83015 Transcript_28267/m.83015 type:complete len:668 (-) Transcript_28267:100-2103(-)
MASTGPSREMDDAIVAAPRLQRRSDGNVPTEAPRIDRRNKTSTMSYDETTIIGGCRSAVLRSFAKIPADWDTNMLLTTFNYLRFGHLHVLRSMQPLLHPIASQSERTELYRAYSIRSTGTVNLLTWRRSALLTCFWIAFGSAILLAAVARTSQDNLYLMQQKALLPTNGTELRGCRYNEPEPILVFYKDRTSGNTTTLSFEQPPERVCEMSFTDYQREIILIAMARTALPAKQIDSILDLILAFFSWVALIPTLMALSRWHRYGISLRLVGAAWMLTFVTPFVISITPVRMFVDWQAMDPVFKDFIAEFRVHFQTAEKEQALINICGLIEDYEGNHPYFLVEGMCSIVDRFPLEINLDGFDDFNLDLRTLQLQCERARELIADGTDQKFLLQAKGACATITPYLSDKEGGSSPELMLAVTQMVETMKGTIELGIGLSHAMMSFQIMVPAAISLAPGLIRGAMRAKTLVPQSSIPGMFILMLPWLYCPLVWCMYNIVFQLLGNLIMLMGLLLLAYGPMTYFVLGVHFNVTKPMTDHKMRQVLTWMNYYIIMYTSVAYCCIVYWLFFTDARKLIEEALKEFKNPQLALSILFSILSKYLYTTLMGVDFMVHEIAEQRRWESYLETGVKPFGGGFQKHLNLSDEAREGVRRLMKERSARLDELARVVHDK